MRVIDGWLEEFLASQRPNLLWERCIRTNEVNLKKAAELKSANVVESKSLSYFTEE